MLSPIVPIDVAVVHSGTSQKGLRRPQNQVVPFEQNNLIAEDHKVHESGLMYKDASKSQNL